MSASNNDLMRNQLMKWSAQSDLKVESISDPRHDFVLSIYQNETLPKLQIIHHKTESAYVPFAGLVNIPEDDRTKLKNLGSKFDELIWDIKLDLLHMDVEFIVWGSEKDPDSWEIQRRLYIGEANVQQFCEAYSKVKIALINVIWSYKKAVEQCGSLFDLDSQRNTLH